MAIRHPTESKLKSMASREFSKFVETMTLQSGEDIDPLPLDPSDKSDNEEKWVRSKERAPGTKYASATLSDVVDVIKKALLEGIKGAHRDQRLKMRSSALTGNVDDTVDMVEVW